MNTTLIGVYGTLKKDFSNHRIIKDAPYIGEASISGTMISLGGFPGFIAQVGDTKVGIEVYDVPPRILVDLDRLEGHPGWYQRRPFQTNLGKVEVYCLRPERYLTDRTEVVTDGIWRGMGNTNIATVDFTTKPKPRVISLPAPIIQAEKLDPPGVIVREEVIETVGVTVV